MNREDWVAVASRLFAIYLFVLCLQFVATSVGLNYGESGLIPVSLILAVSVVSLGIVFYVWMFPLTVARKLLPVMKDSSAGQPVNSTLAFSIGVTLLGVWMFAHSLNDLVYWAVLYLKSRALEPGVWVITPNQYANMASAVVRFLLSLLLMLGSSGIRRVLFRLRYGAAADAA